MNVRAKEDEMGRKKAMCRCGGQPAHDQHCGDTLYGTKDDLDGVWECSLPYDHLGDHCDGNNGHAWPRGVPNPAREHTCRYRDIRAESVHDTEVRMARGKK